MADDNEKSIERVTKIEDVLPYKHIPTAKVLSKRRLLLRSLLFQEQHAVLQHMFSHCYPTEEVPKSKFEITMKMFTTLTKARNEISLLKQRRLEIKALNQKEMFVLNENNYYYRLKKRKFII